MAGDIDELHKLEQLASALDAAPAMLEMASAAMAEEVIGLIKQGFRSETDPYGEKWAPKQRPDGRKVLSGETSRLKGGWHRQKTGKDGFTIAPSVDYAAPHQRPKRGKGGRLKRPRRMMVPDREKGMPAAWSKQLEEAASEIMSTGFRVSFSFRGFGRKARRGRRGLDERLRQRIGLVNRIKQQIRQKIRRNVGLD